jgi:hypothetical protein
MASNRLSSLEFHRSTASSVRQEALPYVSVPDASEEAPNPPSILEITRAPELLEDEIKTWI